MNFRSFGDPSLPPLVVLHGLFGSLDNWIPEGKVFSERFFVHLLDQRGHGDSPRGAGFSYALLAKDLLRFLDKRKIISTRLVGHSLGGKAAMRFALERPERVRRLVVVDIAPKAYPPLHRDIFHGLSSVDPALHASRTEVGRALEPYVPQEGIRRFLLKNLERDDAGRLRWKLDVAGLRKHQEEINGWEETGRIFDGPALFVRGGRSDYLPPEDEPLLRRSFPRARIVTIPEAGHWPHADAPEAFRRRVMDFLRE